METFSALLALCERSSSVSGELLLQRPVMRNLGAFFYLRLQQTARQTIETPMIWDAIALIMTSR